MKQKVKRTLFTIAEAATYVGVDRSTVYRWVDAGDLDAVILSGIRYVARSDMDNLIDEMDDESSDDSGDDSNDENL